MIGSPAVQGTATTREQADRVVEQLNKAGFTRSDIIVRVRDDNATREFTREYSTRAPEAAAIGASAGTALGGMLCLLASVGALTILGSRLLITVGPFAATLYGVVAGALLGGIAGALIGLLIPEGHARASRLTAPMSWVSIEARCTDANAVRKATHVFRDQGVTDMTTSFADSSSAAL